MNKLLNSSFLIAIVMTQFSMKNANLLGVQRIELAQNPFMPIAGLQIFEEGQNIEARILSDINGPFEYSTSNDKAKCSDQVIKISNSGFITFISGKELYFVCVKPQKSTQWQTFSFVEHKLNLDRDYAVENIIGLPEHDSKDRILKLLFPFKSLTTLNVGFGFDQRCKNDMATLKPNVLFEYDLAKLGTKSSGVIVCVSGTKADGTTLPTIYYSFKYSCTSKSGNCQGLGLSRESERELALMTLTASGRIDREEAKKSWLAVEQAEK
jgi:hypothetical protein